MSTSSSTHFMQILSTSTSTNHVSIDLGERPNRNCKDHDKTPNQERLSYNIAKRRHKVERDRCLVRSICFFLIVCSVIGGLVTYIYFFILAWTDDDKTAHCTVASVSAEDSASSNSPDLYLVEISLKLDGSYDLDNIDCFADGHGSSRLHIYEYEHEAPSVDSTYKCLLNLETCELADEEHLKVPRFFYDHFAGWFLLMLCLVFGAFGRCVNKHLRAPEPLAPFRYSDELIVEFVLANWSRTYVPNGYDELNDDCIALDVQTLIFRFYGDDDGEDETT